LDIAFAVVGYSTGYSPCFLKPVKVVTMLLNVLPFGVSTVVSFSLMLAAFRFLFYQSGLRGFVTQSRLAFFVLVTCFYMSCALVPGIPFFTTEEIAAYFECLVNNWVQSQLHRHPKLENCDNSGLRTGPFLFEVTVSNVLRLSPSSLSSLKTSGTTSGNGGRATLLSPPRTRINLSLPVPQQAVFHSNSISDRWNKSENYQIRASLLSKAALLKMKLVVSPSPLVRSTLERKSS